ncbi:MAG: glycine oxidase ThiO [bacterium]|nr:glycine oxidase ThiO [bacterium]
MAETADICIVGGGIIGCSLAFELARAGRRVVVVESDQVGGKASGEAAGMLTPLAEADGPGAFLDLGLTSLAMFPEAEAELKDRTGIDIELLRWGILYLACEEHEAATLAERLAWLSEADLPAEHVSADELRQLEPALADDLLGAMLLPQDWHVNSWNITQAYALAAEQCGAAIYPERPAGALLVEGGRVTGVSTPAGPVHAHVTVNCAGPWAGGLAATAGLSLPMEPVKGQLLSVEARPRPVRHVIYSSRAYVVPRMGGEVVLGTTEERVGFNTRPTPAGVATIMTGAMEVCPALAEAPFLRAWAGLRPTPPDLLPYLGWDERLEGLAVATGHHRNGILLAPITARVMKELLSDEATSVDLGPFSIDRPQPTG